MTIDMGLVTAFGSIIALLIGLKSLGILKPWLTRYAKADELEKLSGKVEDISIEIRTINGKFEKWDDKLDKLMDATVELKIHMAHVAVKKDED